MLVAYMDESGHSKDPKSRFVGMGGLIAESGAWEQLEAAWKESLSEAGLKKAFHMKEFAHRQGEFEGWNEPQRQKLFGQLVKAIVDARVEPTGCVVSLDDYTAMPDILRDFFREPYFMCFQMVTRGAALKALPTTYPFKSETVAMVYAEQEEFGTTQAQSNEENAGDAQKLWHAMKKLTDYGQWMGSYSSDSPTNICPLQAADLFAYELTKEFENLLSRPDDGMRWALKQILGQKIKRGGYPLLQFFDGHEMARIFAESTRLDLRTNQAFQTLITQSWLRKIVARDLMKKRIQDLAKQS